MKIIALCGKKRAGKDTCAAYLETHGFFHMKISTKLKQICKILFDWTDEHVEGNLKEVIDPRWDMTPRKIMQGVGTEMFQFCIKQVIPSAGRDFWIKSVVENIERNRLRIDKVVISDMRFVHEYLALKQAFRDELVVVRLCNNRAPNNDEHESETAFTDIPCDHDITNDGTFISLYDKLDCIIQSEPSSVQL